MSNKTEKQKHALVGFSIAGVIIGALALAGKIVLLVFGIVNMLKCKNCGSEVQEGDKICGNCGYGLVNKSICLKYGTTNMSENTKMFCLWSRLRKIS